MKYLLHLIGVLVASVCLANVIRVPEDFNSIQQATNLAQLNDTISIAPGNYLITQTIYPNRSITYLGRDNNDSGDPVSILNWNGPQYFDMFSYENLINGSNITFCNLDIRKQNNAGNYKFLFLNNANKVIVDNCIIRSYAVSPIVAGDSLSISNTILYSWGYEPLNIEADCVEAHANIFIGNGYSNYYTNNLHIGGQTVLIDRNVITQFYAGEAVWFGAESGVVSNNDFISCRTANGVVLLLSGNMYLENNIIHENTWIEPAGCQIRGYGNVIARYNCIEGGQESCCSEASLHYLEGNISQNPQLDGYYLHEGSPCIDAGDPSSPLDPDGTRADMGAYYYCQGEGIQLPVIVRVTAEPGYPEQLTATLQTTCDPVQIDSAYTDTGLFTLDSYSTQIAQDYSTGTFHLTFAPSVQGLFADTLHIWADTDPPHLKVPLVGEAGPIPAPVTDLSIAILPDLSAQLTWSPVTQTIYGNPVTPDWYLVFYNELDPQVEEEWYYLDSVNEPGLIHNRVARFADLMNYRVVAWKGIDPALLGWETGMKMQGLEGMER